MPRLYSALDLGTNNCRLLIAKPIHGGFRVIDAFSRIVRLGEGVLASGQLSDDAMERAIEALKICSDKINRRGVERIRSVATQACRLAENCSAFVERVREDTGLVLDVITPREEARLAVLGCQALLDRSQPDALIFDIGGGSTELVWVNVNAEGEVSLRAWTSLPMGVVTMTERFGSGVISPAAFEEMVQHVRDALMAFEQEHAISLSHMNGLQLLGTSGTVTTLASLQLGLEIYDRNKVDGSIIDTEAARALSRKLAGMDNEARANYGCIGRERADLVVGGCAILDALLEVWPVTSLRVADRGIREGILRSMMRQDGCHV